MAGLVCSPGFPLFSSDSWRSSHLSAHLLVTWTRSRPNLTYYAGLRSLPAISRPSSPLFSSQRSPTAGKLPQPVQKIKRASLRASRGSRADCRPTPCARRSCRLSASLATICTAGQARFSGSSQKFSAVPRGLRREGRALGRMVLQYPARRAGPRGSRAPEDHLVSVRLTAPSAASATTSARWRGVGADPTTSEGQANPEIFLRSFVGRRRPPVGLASRSVYESRADLAISHRVSTSV